MFLKGEYLLKYQSIFYMYSKLKSQATVWIALEFLYFSTWAIVASRSLALPNNLPFVAEVGPWLMTVCYLKRDLLYFLFTHKHIIEWFMNCKPLHMTRLVAEVSKESVLYRCFTFAIITFTKTTSQQMEPYFFVEVCIFITITHLDSGFFANTYLQQSHMGTHIGHQSLCS